MGGRQERKHRALYDLMCMTLEIIKGVHCDPELPPGPPWTEDFATALLKAHKWSQHFSISVWHDSSIDGTSDLTDSRSGLLISYVNIFWINKWMMPNRQPLPSSYITTNIDKLRTRVHLLTHTCADTSYELTDFYTCPQTLIHKVTCTHSWA